MRKLIILNLLLLPFFSFSQQFLRPISDVTNGGWIRVLDGSTTNLWSYIDETFTSPNSEDNTDEIGMGTGTATYYECLLSAPTGTPNKSSDHTIRIRWRVNGSGKAEKGRVELYQGSTLIYQDADQTMPRSAYTNYSVTLPQSSVGVITDYSNLRIRIVPVDIASTEGITVSVLDFQVPDAAVAKPRSVRLIH